VSEVKAMSKLDCVAFLAGVDLVLSPFVWFLVFHKEELPFAGWGYVSLGKFFVFFIAWGISFYLAEKMARPEILSHVVDGFLFLIVIGLLISLMVFLEDHEVDAPGVEGVLFFARALLPTVITYLLLLLKIRWRAKEVYGRG
jgi:hypothetical protein